MRVGGTRSTLGSERTVTDDVPTEDRRQVESLLPSGAVEALDDVRGVLLEALGQDLLATWSPTPAQKLSGEWEQ